MKMLSRLTNVGSPSTTACEGGIRMWENHGLRTVTNHYYSIRCDLHQLWLLLTSYERPRRCIGRSYDKDHKTLVIEGFTLGKRLGLLIFGCEQSWDLNCQRVRKLTLNHKKIGSASMNSVGSFIKRKIGQQYNAVYLILFCHYSF